MKPLIFLKGDAGDVIKQAVSPADHMPALVREKLAALTHRIQLIILQKPWEMIRLLVFYQNFLSLKEALEHYCTRETAYRAGLNQAGTGLKPEAGCILLPDSSLLLEEILNELKEALAGFVILLSYMQKQHKDQQGFSLALNLLMLELESFTRLLGGYKNQLPEVSGRLSLPAGKASRPRLSLVPPRRRAPDLFLLSA